ncbi:MlaD family protein [Methylococcus sp. EFPC2]|uniref:MlaD family protein n=1 Tax=Methylococcus sp. EFPC2 TaxID=2812648 RepID=UPI001968974E|nr:MlaD family protein [Methylococcus sp. EFPC2]QSA95483.1 MCE family protein [Methylococcus sp. EFPC2]
MNKQVNPVLIGGFVLGAVALAIAGIMVFASGVFTPVLKNIIYFDGSINGLNIGAPVKLKGVTVGKVDDILVVFDAEGGRIMTPVIIEFEPQKFYNLEGREVATGHPTDTKRLIERGLRAQLQLQSLVTGQLFVEVNFRPETPIRLIAGENAVYPEIPSIPSPKEQIENTIDEVVATVRKIPLEETMHAILESIMTVERLLKSPEITSSLATMDHTLKDLQHLVHHLDEKIDPLSKDLQGTLGASRQLIQNVNGRVDPLSTEVQSALKATASAMQQARTTLATVDQATTPNASLDYALRDLSTAANSLRVLADFLQRHPDALLYGKTPEGN